MPLPACTMCATGVGAYSQTPEQQQQPHQGALEARCAQGLTCAKWNDAHRRWRRERESPRSGKQPRDRAIAACCNKSQVPAAQETVRFSQIAAVTFATSARDPRGITCTA
jgi:hypothetical protein